MPRVEFQALEYHADASLRDATYCYEGSCAAGWTVWRNQRRHLQLGPGYVLLRSIECGVCSTDLVRQHLPFPLPQVTGHEVVAEDQVGQRYVVEINASHHALGQVEGCLFCEQGLPTHCPDRLVLGIHDLPGGFASWILAPVRAAIPVPDDISTSSATLIEPFAAALHAVTTVAPRSGDRIAVLGPRRLGMLVIAALAAHRDHSGCEFGIVAVARHPHLLELAAELGADETMRVSASRSGLERLADVVIDTTGTPDGLALATRLAGREVHLKSTHGQPACGLAKLTEFVVDELSMDCWRNEIPCCDRRSSATCADSESLRGAWLADAEPPAWLAERATIHRGSGTGAAGRLLDSIESVAESKRLPRADFAVVGSTYLVDETIRPRDREETSLVRPRGVILLHPTMDPDGSQLLAAVLRQGLRLSSSRCGDFRSAISLMAADPAVSALGEKLITNRFAARHIPESFVAACSAACLKAVVEHAASDWPDLGLGEAADP